MALKRLMLEKELREKKNALEELRSANFEQREKEIEKAIEEAATEEERSAVEEAIEAFEAEKRETEEKAVDLESRISEIENEISAMEEKETKTEERSVELKGEKMERRTLERAPMEVREKIMNSEETKAFLGSVRSAMETRAVLKGDLTVPVVMLDLIRENIFRYSKLINRVRLRTMAGDGRQTVMGTVPEAVWTEMCAKVNELEIGFNQVTLDGYKVAGFLPLCNAVKEDSEFDLAAEIIEVLGQSIGYALDKAIIYGKGAASKMPLGIVTRLAQTQAPAGYPADAPAWVDVSDTNILQIPAASNGTEFYSDLVMDAAATVNTYARGRRFWAMNSKTYATLIAKALTVDGAGALVSGVDGTMPVIGGDIDVLEFIPDGDIIGGYGELYVLGERRGLAIDMSEHAQFIEDNTVFRAKARYDGHPVIANAFVAININGGDVTTSMEFAPITNP